MYLVFFLYALLASTFSIGKLLMLFLPPIFLIAVRMIIAGTIVSGFSYVFDRKINIKSSDAWLFGVVIIFHILLPFICEYIALEQISPASACLMYNLSPFISALLSYFIFDETMTIKKWVGFFIGIVGILLYIHTQLSIDTTMSWSHLLMFISVMTSCLGWIFVRILIKHKNYSPFLVNGIAMFIGGWIALPISKLYGECVAISIEQVPSILALLGMMIVITNIIFYNLYGYLLTRYTATFLSFAGFVTPLFAALFEWLFFGTIVPYSFFITVIIVGAGIFLFYQEELRQGYIAE